ncbi:MAG: crossover junction endodeoxyribonuclease RuvC [Patescibacteria group bacterium]
MKHSAGIHKSVIAIDPGYDRLGVAVLADDGTLLTSECFSPNSKIFTERLLQIKNRIRELVETHHPSSLALETLFFSKNQKTALKVAEARGVIIVLSAELELPLYEYSPQAVKIAVTGSGNADKTSVIKMVERLVKLAPQKRQDDEYDAIALGIAHQASFTFKR